MKSTEGKTNARPRAVVVFDNEAEYQEFENYAKSKSLDIKSFLKFAARAYMVRFPLITNAKAKDAKVSGNAD